MYSLVKITFLRFQTALLWELETKLIRAALDLVSTPDKKCVGRSRQGAINDAPTTQTQIGHDNLLTAMTNAHIQIYSNFFLVMLSFLNLMKYQYHHFHISLPFHSIGTGSILFSLRGLLVHQHCKYVLFINKHVGRG